MKLFLLLTALLAGVLTQVTFKLFHPQKKEKKQKNCN